MTTDTQPDSPPTADSSQLQRWRWRGLVLLLTSLAAGAIVFSEQMPWLLAAVVIVALAAILSDAGLTPQRLPHILRQTGRRYRRQLRAVRQQIAVRRTYTLLFGLLSVLFMLLAAHSFIPKTGYEWVDDGVIWMLAGALALGIPALLVPRNARPLHADDILPASPDVLLTGTGLLLLLIVAELSGNLLQNNLIDGISMGLQFVLWLGGIICLSIGLSNRVPAGRGSLTWLQAHAAEVVLLALVVLLGFVLRVVGLETVLRASIDEALAAQGVVNYWWNMDAGIAAAPSSYISSYVYPYLQSLIATLHEPSVTNLRLLSSVVGTVNIIGVYLLARELFDKRVALAAALVLVTLPPHLHFSRLGLSHIADATVGTFIVYWLTRALRYNRRPDWVLAGLMIGLSQYFFEAGRLFFPLFVGVWLLCVAVFYRQHMHNRWRGVLVMVVMAIAVALPVYYAIYASDGDNAARLSVSGAGSSYWSDLLAGGLNGDEINELLWRFSLPFHGYIRLPSGALFYGGTEPMILPLIAPLFLLGFFWILWRRQPLALVIPLWIMLVPLSNGLLREVLVFARFVVVFPALAIALGVGIGQVIPALIPTDRNRITWGVVLLLAAGTAGIHGSYYFNVHAPTLLAQIRTREGAPDALDTVLRANDLPPDTTAYAISHPLADINVMRSWLVYLRHNRTDITIELVLPRDVTPAFVEGLPARRYYAFFVAPGNDDVRDVLAQYYDLGDPQPSPADIAPHDQFDLYLVDTYQQTADTH